MAKLDADGQTITLPCGHCGQKFTQTIGWLKLHGAHTCQGCGAVTTVDLAKHTQGIAQAQKALDQFEASLRKFGKR